MDAAHHLARQVVPRRDIELKDREHDSDDIGQMSPAAGPKTFWKSMFEIIELTLTGPSASSACSIAIPRPNPRDAYIIAAPAGYAASLIGLELFW